MVHELEAGRLRRAVQCGARLWFRRHAREEMAADSIYEIDIHNMLARCRVTLVEFKKDELWRAEGTDFDGRKIAVVVHLDEASNEIGIITAWAHKEG